MNWIKITKDTLRTLPKDRTFLIWDSNATSGVSVYEAMIFNEDTPTPTVGCPASTEDFNLEEFSHWAEIIPPKSEADENDETIRKQFTTTIPALYNPPVEPSWEQKFRWETARMIWVDAKGSAQAAIEATDMFIKELKK